jgi:hypothetical protein
VGVHFQVVAYKELTTFPSEWEVWKRLFQSVVSSQVWKNVFQIFKFQVLSSKCVKESSSKCYRISKCVEESSSSCWKFQHSSLRCVQERFLKLLKTSSFKCVKNSSLLTLQVSSQISNLCKKVFQVFEGFYWKQLENKQEMKDSRFMKCNNCIN